MILEIKKKNKHYILDNFPKNKEHYFIKVKVENITSVKNKYVSKSTVLKIKSDVYNKAIESLNKILILDPENTFIKRKIKALSKPRKFENEMTDDEALYLALSDKYDL